LRPEEAVRLLLEVYNPICVLEWSEAEVWHKVWDAYEQEPRRGWLLQQHRR
jgi:hypothetical protein